jgi:hypothetical protein
MGAQTTYYGTCCLEQPPTTTPLLFSHSNLSSIISSYLMSRSSRHCHTGTGAQTTYYGTCFPEQPPTTTPLWMSLAAGPSWRAADSPHGRTDARTMCPSPSSTRSSVMSASRKNLTSEFLSICHSVGLFVRSFVYSSIHPSIHLFSYSLIH